MKQIFRLAFVAVIAGAFTLGGYKLFLEPEIVTNNKIQNEASTFIPTNYTGSVTNGTNIDFTNAAEKTVHAVVHVKNTTISTQPSSLREYFSGGGTARAMIGSGSGVIISPDGYIITNNHVIDNSSQLEITLNNNKTYTATLVGTDPKTDIALIKVEPDGKLPYIPFGDSNELKIGEWVLAVGNPFNLTSTVTAGIVSAKARDLNEFDGNPQSFIQTDAAVNRGNSGGALVNTRGELIGINTAITSETGNYVGYSFAVPSNNARKVIEDIMEFGNVQRGILGITGRNLNSDFANNMGIDETEGVFVNGIEKGSGADKSGIEQGDIIKEVDGIKIGKFSDLVGYLGSKRPNDEVQVTLLRDGKKRNVPVTLIKLETYELEDLGLEIKNATKSELKNKGLSYGVKVNRALTRDIEQYNLAGIIILKINDKKVSSINDAQRIMDSRHKSNPIKITFMDQQGDMNSFIFR
ncbi:MAG: trypsin-like peptidase domain-containing protein [Flavobacteriaceae bacterium]|nr:trypsin-like peptidase domain-containing protein [Flavobacteriaceae bacterium]